MATISTALAVTSYNTSATITFSEAVFKSNGTTQLTATELSLALSGGTATLSSYTVSTTDDKTFTFALTLSGTSDGAEVLTLTGNVYNSATTLTAVSTTVTFDDLAGPTMTITSATVNDGDTSNDASIALTFTSSEATTNFAVGDISVGNGAISAFNASSSTVYTATFTPTAQGACTIDVNGSTFTDAAGNNNTAATQFNWTFDSVSPTAAITYSVAGPYKQNATATITATFTESLTNTPKIAISGVSSTAATNMSGSGTTWTYAYTAPAGDGTETIALSVGTDAAGNVVAATPSSGSTFVVDNTVPTLSSVSIASDNTTTTLAKVGDDVTLTFTASETIQTPVVTFTSGSAAITDASIAYANTSGNTWTAVYTTNSSDTNGSVAYSIAFSDSAGNAGTAVTTGSGSVRFDKTNPAVTSFVLSDSALKKGDTSTVTLTFSEAVSGFSSAADITVVNGTLTTMTSSDNITWTGTFTPTDDLEDATNVLTLANTYIDLAGNTGVSSTTSNYDIDTTAPTVTITSTTVNVSSGGATVHDRIAMKFVTSETTTDFVVGDVTVTNGALSSFAGSGTTYTATLTPTTFGAVTVKVAASVFTDAAGNNNTVSSTFTWTYVDPTTGNIDIPLIFDMSGNATVFGEDISGEAVGAHIKLKLAATSTQSTNFINAFKNIYYSDPSDNISDTSGVYFYKSFANSNTGGLGEVIRNLLFDSTVIKHSGTVNSDRFGSTAGAYGIPIGALQTTDDPSGTQANYYDGAFIDSDGTEFHKILIRVAAAHLMGHPFAQGFIQENSVKDDLKACDLSNQIINSFDLDNLTQTTVDTRIADASGTHVPVLQSIYEQLLNKNIVDMSGQDQSGAVFGVTKSLVFKTGNVVSFYIRPRLFFKVDTAAGISKMGGAAVGNALGISGTTLNTDLSGGGGRTLFNEIFSINNSPTNPTGYRWLVGRGDSDVSPKINQWQTNLEIDDDISGQLAYSADTRHGMLDAHIWKIDITL